MPYASLTLHRQARGESAEAFSRVFKRPASICERQFLQAVALLESTYGYAWRGDGIGSNNMGAIQDSKGPPCDPARAFGTRDTHEDGTVYSWCYRKYRTRGDGWDALVRELFINNGRERVRRFAALCEIDSAVAEMRESGYFEAPLERYREGIEDRIREIAGALGEPAPAPKGVQQDG